MKVAYFSPLPPSRSGIADYSALLVPALSRLVDVEVVRIGRTRPVVGADVAVYHIGNNPDAHGWIVDALRRSPGVVVLHEFVLHHLVAGLTIGRRDPHAYLAAMERDSGVPGRLLGYGVLEGRVPPLWEVRPEDFPLVGEILDRATGVIVHSAHVEARVREAGYEGRLWRIPHPAWPVEDVKPATVEGSPLYGCFGHLNESKRIPQLLEAFARVRRSRSEARLLLVGPSGAGFDLEGRIERLGLPREGVQREDYVEESRLWSLVAACDACVALRAPTMGETSGSVIRELSLGKPLVVSDLGWFAELPDEVALKVPVGDGEVEALAAALERLADDYAARTRMGAAATAYVEREHSLDRVAGLYAAALEEAAGGAAVREAVLRDVARAAADVGVDPIAAGLPEQLEAAGIAERDGRAPAPVRTRRRLRAGPVGLWLAAIVVVSAVVQFLLGRRVVAPWIMVDELIYSDMARSFAASGHFLIRGVHGDYGPVYPAILALAYKLTGSVPHAYTAARAINAPLMSLAAIPAYFLARRVLRPWTSLAAAALAVAIPSMAYVGTLMTENVFYPLFVCVALALVLMLERPTVGRQLLALALCAVAFETRAQAVALVAAVATAPLVLAWIERGRPGRLAAFKTLYGVLAAAVLVVIVVEAARGRSPLDALGNYSVTGSVSYEPWPAFRWLVYHLAELDLALWLLPFAALIVVVASARHLDAPVRAFAAAATTISVWLLLEVSVFASHYSGRIEERNLFYLAPLFLTGLLVWIDRGQPRPPRVTVAAAGLAAVLPGAIPFARLLRVDAESDTIGLQPWWYLSGAWTGVHAVGVAVVLVSLALGAAFLWLPARYSAALPAVVAAGFLATWLPLEQWKHSFPRVSSGTYFQGIKDQRRDWIDRRVGRDGDVAAIWTNRSGNRFTIWQNEFWNKSVRRVYDVGATIGGGMPEIPVRVRREDGLLTRADNGEPLRVPYVLTDDSFAVVGTPVARDRARGMVLYRVTQPVRSTRRIEGLYDDRWSQPTLTWTQAGCRGGTLRVALHGDSSLFPNGQTVVAHGARVVRERVPTNGETTLAVPVGSSCTVTFRVSPTARPSDVLGNNDTREVGTHFDRFDYSAG